MCVASRSRVGQPGEGVLRRDRAIATARSASDAVAAGDVIGRDHRLAAADQHPQADVVAFGALRFLDRAVAHLDRERDRAHRDRIGGIGAGAAGGGHQPFGKIGERGLIEK